MPCALFTITDEQPWGGPVRYETALVAHENQQQFDQDPFSRRFGDADTTEFQEINAI